MRALALGVVTADGSVAEATESLEELADLLTTLGYQCVDKIFQKRAGLVASTLLGSGKIAEIAEQVARENIQLVAFDHELSGAQQRNLEKLLACKVLDRSAVILEIFSEHARTNQAKLQVEIATLEYLLPRLTGAWTHFQRQKGGGAQSRGMGEKQIEVDRRATRDGLPALVSSFCRSKKKDRCSRELGLVSSR